MRAIVNLFAVIVMHLNFNLAYVDATDHFVPTLKAMPFDAIDVVLFKLGLFVDCENRSFHAKATQLKFIHTYNRMALTSVIKTLRQSWIPLNAIQP